MTNHTLEQRAAPDAPWNNPAPLPSITQTPAATKEHHHEPADL